MIEEKEKLTGKMNVGTIKIGIEPTLIDLEVTPSKEKQEFNHEEAYGYDEVKVNPIPEEYIIPNGQIDITENGKYNVMDYKDANVNIEPFLQEKEVTPTKETQTIQADQEYNGLETVTVNPIPSEYIIPDGTLEITSNGIQDVTNYAKANVNVNTKPNLQDKSIEITENGTQTIQADSEYDGLNNVEVITNVPTTQMLPTYTIEEQVVGKWINNKPLYRKTLVIETTIVSGSNDEVEISHGINNIENVFIGDESHITDVNGESYQMNMVNVTSNGSVTMIKTTARTKVVYSFIQSGMIPVGAITKKITLYFTKTTDTATEEELGTLNYSTDERIVGTDVDGNTLYQKTISNRVYYAPNGGTRTTNLNHNIANVKDIYMINNGSFIYFEGMSGTSRDYWQLNGTNFFLDLYRQFHKTIVNKTRISTIFGDWAGVGNYYRLITTLRYTKAI